MISTMATVNYLIRTQRKGIFASIYIRLKDGRKVDYRVKTDFKIPPEFWNGKSQSFKKGILFTDSFTEKDKVEVEDRLRDLKNFVLKSYNKRVVQGKPITKEWFLTTFSEFFNKSETVETLNSFISKFINEIETGVRLYSHNNRTERYKPLTIKNYKGFQAQFNEFQGIYTIEQLNKLGEEEVVPRPHRVLDFEDITMDLYDQLVVFFNDKSYSPNTIGRHIKTLKVIMRHAKEQGLHNNNEFERKKFKTIKIPVREIYLNEKELKSLLELDLNEDHSLEIARDVFLIGCFTAQRFSDYSRIRKENIRTLEKGMKVIDLIQKKTGEQVLIPIRPELERLLKKYDYNVPKIFEQKLNSKIKEVGEKAGITELVLKEEIRGGLTLKKEVPKNTLIKTHTARRSGCTNMYIGGVKVLDIMKISGHKSEREFLQYIKISKEETMEKLQNHPYFTQSQLKLVN